MGDPAGVGPELICRVLAEDGVHERCRPVVVGDPAVIRAGAGAAGIALDVAHISDLDAARFRPRRINVLTAPGTEVPEHAWGVMTASGGSAALTALTVGAGLPVDALVSAPLNKAALHLAGMRHSDELGHLAAITGTADPILVGVLPSLWTICVTSHVPLRAVADGITHAAVLAAIEQLARARSRVRRSPRLAVAGLNPHAGEGGHLGREEIERIEPAVAAARQRGIDAVGPWPADTLFPRAFADGIDGVVCMYHDQANIARKLQPRDAQATLYLGLPVPVATTAHGTAYDQAGQGTASAASLRAALESTIALTSGRR
jgi:4-hydroxythreonine-4-phosphate dehydrogenase